MNLWAINILLCFLTNGIRFYAIKRSIGIFVTKEQCTWKHMNILYIIGWFFTAVISLRFSLPAYNVITNVLALYLILMPYKIKWTKKFLMVFTIYVVNVMVDSIVYLSTLKYLEGQPVNRIYECITCLLFLVIAIILERTLKTNKEIDLPLTYMITFGMIPIISIGCIYYFAVTILQYHTAIVIVSVGFLFINIFIFYLYHSLLDYYSARMEKQMMEQLMEVYEHQLNLVQESQIRVKALRHDMKHHIIELAAMAQEDGNNEIVQYLDKMKDFMLNPEERVSTGNSNIDGLLNYLLQGAEKTLKQIDIKINIPERMYEKNFSICVILGNLLDNAIREAGNSQEKYLSRNIQEKQGILLIFIENSYSHTIIETNNIFKTTQQNFTIHGLGLENVKRVVSAAGGEMKFSYTKERFCVQVLLYVNHIM